MQVLPASSVCPSMKCCNVPWLQAERVSSSGSASFSGRIVETHCDIYKRPGARPPHCSALTTNDRHWQYISRPLPVSLQQKKRGFLGSALLLCHNSRAFCPLPSLSSDRCPPLLPPVQRARQLVASVGSSDTSTAAPESTSADLKRKPQSIQWEDPLVYEVGVEQPKENSASGFSIKKPERDFQKEWRSQALDVDEQERDGGFMTRTVRLVQVRRWSHCLGNCRGMLLMNAGLCGARTRTLGSTLVIKICGLSSSILRMQLVQHRGATFRRGSRSALVAITIRQVRGRFTTR
jgi:hypothetical protein